MSDKFQEAVKEVRAAFRAIAEYKRGYRKELVREGARSYFIDVPINEPRRCPTCGK